MMSVKLGAVKMKSLKVANIDIYSIHLPHQFLSLLILIIIMNPTMNSNNPDLPNTPILNEVKTPIAGQTKVAITAPRFGLSRFQPSTTPLPPFTPPANFGLNDPSLSASSSVGPSARIDSRANCEAPTALLQSEAQTSTTTNAATSSLLIANQVSISSDRKNTFRTSEPVQDFSKLNRSDINELFENHTLLDPAQSNFLRTVQRKKQLHPQRYRDDYLRHSSILLLSNGWTSAIRFSMCSVPNSMNRSGQCRLHKYCPYCSFLERQNALCRYVPAFERGTWFFLTGSFTGDLAMVTNTSYYELMNYWEAYKLALRELAKEGLVRGVFWTEELAVNSIAPVRTLPHIHATIEADEVSEATVEQLSESVSAHLKSALGPDCLTPNIHIKPLDTQRKLFSHIHYQIKPIQIVRAYDLAWSRSLHNERAGAVKLNSDTTDLVLGYSEATKMRAKLNHCGNLSPKTNAFIGTKAADMKEARKILSEVMRDGVDRVELGEEVACVCN